MNAAAQFLANSPRDIAAMRRDAWAGFVSDLLLGGEWDRATARARYDGKTARITELERGGA